MQHFNHELTTSNIRLTRTNADFDTCVYTASHNLKSPITSLEWLLAVLRDTLPVDVQQQRLFQAFEWQHTHVAGTGVGLRMIKRLIKNAGASIAVTSAPNVGSTFTVTFPA